MIVAREACVGRALFGGGIQGVIPARFLDVSDFRPVPDNQEVWADGDRDQSIIVELLERVHHVADAECASWFFHDLAGEMSAGCAVLEGTRPLAPEDVPGLDSSIPKYLAVGSQLVAKYREGPEARNLVKVHMAIIRIGHPYDTDILITLYEPLVISEHSSSAAVVASGEGQPLPTEMMTAEQVFAQLLATITVNDWGLFGGAS